jgi:flagellar M-ring protein FliF
MPGTRPNFVNQLREIWSRLQTSQRITIIGFAVLALAGIGTLVFLMNRVEYEVLYRDLNIEDAQAIAAKLKDEKRDFIVEGTSIRVAAPKSEIDKLRLEVAGSGLARSGRVGYEIFDKSQFGMTDFTEQVNLQRALEGELSRTISNLSEITQARVHITLGKDSIFEQKKEEAKASVAVRLKKGAELAKTQIAGIKNLIAGAVPGLRPHSVSVVDEEGKLLSQSVGSGDDARSEAESGIREQLEKEMTSKVVSILEPVVGKGKVHANASIDLDFNSTEQTEETYNPGPGVVLSQQKSEEKMGSANTIAGIPGTQSNKANGSPTPSSSTTPERVRQSEVTNYEVSKLVRHTIQPKGSVRRLSVAVILDHKAIYNKGQDGKITTTFQPRTQQELDSCRELVLAAVGYDKERGDIVTLENVPFFKETRPEEDQPPLPWYVKWQSYLLPAMKYTSFLLLFLLVYLVLFRPIHKRVFRSIEEVAPALAPAGIAQIEGAPPRALPEAATPEGLPAGDQEAAAAGQPPEYERAPTMEEVEQQIEREFAKEAESVNVEGRKYAILKKKLADRAMKEPEMVAQLLRSWMHGKDNP